MQDRTRQKIADLESDIARAEEELDRRIGAGRLDGIEQSLHRLESDLKYLSILANGSSAGRDEDRRIMDFLRTHYNRLRDYSLPAGRGA